MVRGTSSVIAVILLVGITVALSAAVGSATFDALPRDDPHDSVSIETTASSSGQVVLTHRGGSALDVRTLQLVVTVDGTPLEHQPPIPFFATTGFRSGPTGPFNVASDPTWEVGERASFWIASTNEPTLDHGATITVRILKDDSTVAVAGTTVR